MRGIRRASLSLLPLLWLAGCGPQNVPASTEATPVAGASRLSGLLGSGSEGFPRVTEPRVFRFPDDHGPHPQYRNEWWYLTGNLWTNEGRRFGYELTLFRFALSPDAAIAGSPWRSNQVYIGHFAVADAARESFHVAQRFARGALGLAGAETGPLRVWVYDWEVTAADPAGSGMPWTVRAEDGDVSISLSLDARKAPVLNGERGLSQKSGEAGNASYYYSMTRMQTDGTLQVGGAAFEVAGTSWLDREWSSSALSAEQVGWDWFALQFDNGAELMYYQLRRQDGTADPWSAGTWVGADGRVLKLSADDVRIDVLDTWESPLGGRYPSRWSLRVPRLDIDVVVSPVFEDQELDTTVRYWEGAVDVIAAGSAAAAGRGYVELTGYAGD